MTRYEDFCNSPSPATVVWGLKSVIRTLSIKISSAREGLERLNPTVQRTVGRPVRKLISTLVLPTATRKRGPLPQPSKGGNCDRITDNIKGKYLSTFIDLLGKYPNYSCLTKEQVTSICEKACELFDTDFDRNGYVGIAIAGYGEEEVYPHMVHIHVSGFINGKIRYYIQDRIDISENTGSSIVPLAQRDVMQTFLFGINDEFLSDLSQEIPKQLNESIQALDDACFAPEESPSPATI